MPFFFFSADLSSISALLFNKSLLNFNMHKSITQRAIKGVFVHRVKFRDPEKASDQVK